MPFTNLPGIIQLARSPRLETCIPPSIVTSRWWPLIIANDWEDEKNEAPGRTDTVCLLAFIRSESTSAT